MNKMKNKIEELVAQGELKEALKLIEKNQKDLFLNDPIEILDLHLYILLELGLFDECFLVLDEYKTYPYINIEVEEELMSLSEKLPGLIKKALLGREKERNVDENGIDFSKFHSKNKSDLVSFLYKIYDANLIVEYEHEIKNVLKRNVSDNVNFMCLCMLSELNSNEKVDFWYKNSNYSVNLSEIQFPFSKKDTEYFQLLNELNFSINDVSILATSKDLLNFLRLEIFPEHFDINELSHIKIAIVSTVRKMYGEDVVLIKNPFIEKYMDILEKITKS